MDSAGQVNHRKQCDGKVSISDGATSSGANIWKERERSRSPSQILRDELDSLRFYGKGNENGTPLGDLLDEPDLLHKPKVNFCSPKTPWKRRLQTLVVAWHVGSFIYMAAFTLLAMANPLMWVVLIPYFLYYMVDRTPANGRVTRRYSIWFRSLALWQYYCNYYPIRLHKVADIPPTFTDSKARGSGEKKYKMSFKIRLWPLKHSLTLNILKKSDAVEKEATGPRYIFGYHPHGVAALGAFGAFATEGCSWSELFPGIPVCLMTLINQFQIPFYRDYLLSLGITSVSRKNALKVLDQNFSICIVVGGAQEALTSKIGSADLVLKRRKGFVKLALETGKVGIVPCFAFGETDCYNILQTDEKSYLRRMQLWFKRSFGFTIPFFFARGVFNYDFGLIPYRRPINIVVGRPVFVEKKYENPSIEDIDYYQKLYIQELERIFHKYKEQFGYKEMELNYVE